MIDDYKYMYLYMSLYMIVYYILMDYWFLLCLGVVGL